MGIVDDLRPIVDWSDGHVGHLKEAERLGEPHRGDGVTGYQIDLVGVIQAVGNGVYRPSHLICTIAHAA